jgi:hypothetical protein
MRSSCRTFRGVRRTCSAASYVSRLPAAVLGGSYEMADADTKAPLALARFPTGLGSELNQA